MAKDERSIGAGITFTALGAGLILYSLATLETGTMLRMGPGYFPLMIGGGLVVIGVLTLMTMRGDTRIALRTWPWRAIFIVLGSILVFAISLSRIGFVPATFLMTLIAARARASTPLWLAALSAAGITLFCALVFVIGLGVPFRLFF